jgi:hypothetical protein
MKEQLSFNRKLSLYSLFTSTPLSTELFSLFCY